jgi:uncharacterized membrane protein SpoIIM required for sporulation
MREALFIKKNVSKWEEYQHVPAANADEKADRFIELLDDLAYSRTFYPHSKVTRWINNIAANIYRQIYRNRKEHLARLRNFWTDELPEVLYRRRYILLFTFLLFALSMAVGIVSSIKDDTFIKSILGEGYVSMTEENIEKGDPFGVYRDENKLDMFVRIAANNILVSFQAFIYGIAFGVGTIYILFYNGVMVGAFEQMFFAKGLGWESIMVIWIHGTIEILSIILAGAAGIILGTGYLFPGTYSRGYSFRRSAADSIKLIIAMVPFFLLAASLESYVTYQMSNAFSKGHQQMGMPIWGGALILLLSLFLMVGYFAYYPWLKYGKPQGPAPNVLKPYAG